MDHPKPVLTPRFILTTIAILVFGAASNQFFFTHTGATLLFILLVTGLYKLANKQPAGWMLLSSHFYFNCYRNPGGGSWIMLALSLYTFYVHIQWRKGAI